MQCLHAQHSVLRPITHVSTQSVLRGVFWRWCWASQPLDQHSRGSPSPRTSIKALHWHRTLAGRVRGILTASRQAQGHGSLRAAPALSAAQPGDNDSALNVQPTTDSSSNASAAANSNGAAPNGAAPAAGDGLLGLPLLLASTLSHVNIQYMKLRRRRRWWKQAGGYPKASGGHHLTTT